MKKHLLLIMLCCGFAQFASAQFSFGAGVSLITAESKDFGVQARLIYGLNDKVDLSGTYNYYLDNSYSAYDFDVHYNLIESDGGFTISPLAGIRITSIGDASTSLQLGGYIVIPTEKINLYLEPKFIIDNTTIFLIAAGIEF